MVRSGREVGLVYVEREEFEGFVSEAETG